MKEGFSSLQHLQIKASPAMLSAIGNLPGGSGKETLHESVGLVHLSQASGGLGLFIYLPLMESMAGFVSFLLVRLFDLHGL